MIREFGESVGEAVLKRTGRAAAGVQERRPLPADLLESDDAYLAVFDVPGAAASDVQVRYSDGRVLVRVDRFRSFHDGFTMQFPGRGLSLDGEVDLPDDAVVTADEASATLTDRGTLEVRLPKVATAEVDVGLEGEGEMVADEGEMDEEETETADADTDDGGQNDDADDAA
ncbi:molecular chaperone [Salinarchaeum sp. Harcht-Bsk1]|uniref:Hsp20/alpha crystallin family protein n=1 Tax=Salinarchaeum sp. Harcht-Bsk1 TaxID=1333523 RepID=UPI00034231E4|nr:Hsp20/alpha crystallin family protein [Salinarchaeum sp. Harcht-Bsk1]AGN00781.1 molecular chaperone [Salinarchaeum sp. Harcht-Bsk1]